MPMTQTSRVAAISTVCVVLGLGAATTAHAHLITVADLPAGYARARLMPPFPGGLLPAGSMTEMFVNVTNSSLFEARITAFGFNLPGGFSNFTLTSTTSAGFTLSNDVGGVPGLPGATLDFALLTGGTFASGNPGVGIAPGQTVSFSVVGPFPSTFNFERILDDVVVRFEQAGPTGAQTGTGFGPSAAAVPEPVTTMLLGIGLGGWGLVRRGRRHVERQTPRSSGDGLEGITGSGEIARRSNAS
jgi:hypothetical protein